MSKPEIMMTYFGDKIVFEVFVYENDGCDGSFLFGKQLLDDNKGELFYAVHRSAQLAVKKVRLTLGNELSWLYMGSSREQADIHEGQVGPLACSPLGSAMVMLGREQYDQIMNSEFLVITVTYMDGVEARVRVEGVTWRYVRGQMHLIKLQND